MNQSIPDILGKVPFIRFTVPLLMGIAFAELGFQPSFNVAWAVVLIGLCYLLLSSYAKKLPYSLRWVWGMLAFIVLFFSGVSLWQAQKKTSELPVNQPVLLNAVVVEHPVQKPKTVQLQLRVDAYKQDSGWIEANEKITVYFLTDDDTQQLPQAGERIVFSSILRLIEPPSNPEEFDYRSYMQRRGYYATAFVKASACEVVEENALPFYKAAVLKLQKGLLRTFENAGIEGQELAVLMALTIGDKQLLDDDLKQAYSSAGIIHILAVSGLHVGLLYVLLTYLLFFLRGKRYRVMLKTVIILLCLWLYAAIADFSPSVTRATIMFSFVLFAQLWGRQASTLNAVFASAFFICLFKPLSLFEVGFQLSYLAVLGILAFYSKLSKLQVLNNPILKGAWNICCVSFSAQLAVLPLSVFYFHQLPVYFLLANVLVLPLVAVATYLIVLLLLVSFIPFVSTIVGCLLGACIWVVSYIASAIQRLPYSAWSDIYISPLQLVLFLLALLCLMLLIHFRRKTLFYGAGACFVLALSLGIAHGISTARQLQLVVFNTNNASFMAFVEGHNAICIRDDANFSKSFDYNTNGYFIRQRVDKKNIQTVAQSELSSFSFSDKLRYDKGLLWFAGQSVKLLGSTSSPQHNSEPLPIAVLVITNSFKGSVSEQLGSYAPKLVVIDSSVSEKKAKEWVAVLNAANIPYHSVREMGAFVMTVR